MCAPIMIWIVGVLSAFLNKFRIHTSLYYLYIPFNSVVRMQTNMITKHTNVCMEVFDSWNVCGFTKTIP